MTDAGRGTFLGYRNSEGLEMHCAHAFCPHAEKCKNGCTDRVARSAMTDAGEREKLADEVGKDLACTRTYTMREWAMIETALRNPTRAEAIEECAKVCNRWIASKNLFEHLAATDIAKAIRALAPSQETKRS
jgi:hypothetical protein